MSRTTDINGWTTFGASVDTRQIYVCSTGSNSNDGLTSGTPKQTISAGAALMRNGFPDHLLLKCGDTFTNQTFGTFSDDSGRSADERWLFSYYGTGNRPKILTSGDAGGIIGLDEFSNIAIIGIHFEPTDRDPSDLPNGIGIGPTPGHIAENILIEDCYIKGYKLNIQLGGGDAPSIFAVEIRRNVIIDSWSTSTHSQGIYSATVDGLLIEGNFIDHNGWHETISGAEATIFNHNMYITHFNLNVTIHNNISSRASSMGLKFQPVDGTHYVTNNLFVQNSYSAQIGGGAASIQVGHSGATIYANDNVIVDGKGSSGGGLGVTVSNVKSGTFSNNIVANPFITGNSLPALSLQDGMGWETIGVGVRNFEIANNIFYNWRSSISIVQPTETYQTGSLPVMSNIDFINNVIQEPNIAFTSFLINTYSGSSSIVSFFGDKYYRAYDVINANTTMRIGSTSQSLATWETNTSEASASPETFINYLDPNRGGDSFAVTRGYSNWLTLITGTTTTLSTQSLNWMANDVNCYIWAGYTTSVPMIRFAIVGNNPPRLILKDIVNGSN